jgi:hypothetical protein
MASSHAVVDERSRAPISEWELLIAKRFFRQELREPRRYAPG